MKALDLMGRHFGKLSVIGIAPNRGAKRMWVCLCDCGRVTASSTSDLTLGKSTKCRVCAVKRHGHTRNGKGGSPTYTTWQAMKDRCLNPNATGYRHYGGRGISVCERWLESFDNFLADMGPRPGGTSLDRIDNNGGYTPENCRWATHKEQAQNRTWNPASAWKHGRNQKGQFQR